MCQTCKNPATPVGDWHHCGVCERPVKPGERTSPSGKPALCKPLSRNCKAKTIASNMWHYDPVPSEGDAKRWTRE